MHLSHQNAVFTFPFPCLLSLICAKTIWLETRKHWYVWKVSSTKLLLQSLNSADAFSRQLCHIPDGIPFFKREMASLYSSFFWSADFFEPGFRPSLPPLAIYCFLPDCRRKVMLSLSNCAQVESVANMIGANKDGLPSSPSKLNCCVPCNRRWLRITQDALHSSLRLRYAPQISFGHPSVYTKHSPISP